jgi:hypothetical protein
MTNDQEILWPSGSGLSRLLVRGAAFGMSMADLKARSAMPLQSFTNLHHPGPCSQSPGLVS